MDETPIAWQDLETYRRFAGDLDGHVRCTSAQGRVSDSTWRRIDDLRQRMLLVRPGACAPAFVQQLEADLRRFAPDAHVLAALQRIVAADRARADGEGKPG